MAMEGLILLKNQTCALEKQKLFSTFQTSFLFTWTHFSMTDLLVLNKN